MASKEILFDRGVKYLNESKIDQFYIRNFIYHLEISRAQFYKSYLYYTDYLEEMVEYFFYSNNPIDKEWNIYDLVEKDILFIAKNEFIFINLIFITRKQATKRNQYLKDLYYKRIIESIILSNSIEFHVDNEIQNKIIYSYADYFIYRCTEWIVNGSLMENLTSISDLWLLGRELFCPSNRTFKDKSSDSLNFNV